MEEIERGNTTLRHPRQLRRRLQERELPTSRQSARCNDYCITPTQCTSFLLKFVLVVGASIWLAPWPSPGPLVSRRAGTLVVTVVDFYRGDDRRGPLDAAPAWNKSGSPCGRNAKLDTEVPAGKISDADTGRPIASEARSLRKKN